MSNPKQCFLTDNTVTLIQTSELRLCVRLKVLKPLKEVFNCLYLQMCTSQV